MIEKASQAQEQANRSNRTGGERTKESVDPVPRDSLVATTGTNVAMLEARKELPLFLRLRPPVSPPFLPLTHSNMKNKKRGAGENVMLLPPFHVLHSLSFPL
jgi:hypothetical protein